MSEFEGYTESWMDFLARSDHDATIFDYLQTSPNLQYINECRHLLSIGAGTGRFERRMMDLMPDLEQYTAVDPNKDLLDINKQTMADLTKVKKFYINKTMQMFEGPTSTADLILFVHSAYYFSNTFEEQMERAFSWLSEEGHIVFVIDISPSNEDLVDKFKVGFKDTDSISKHDIKQRMHNMGNLITEKVIGYILDLSSPGDNYYSCLSIFLNRKGTKEEMDEALQILMDESEKKSGKHVINQAVLVVRKP